MCLEEEIWRLRKPKAVPMSCASSSPGFASHFVSSTVVVSSKSSDGNQPSPAPRSSSYMLVGIWIDFPFQTNTHTHSQSSLGPETSLAPPRPKGFRRLFGRRLVCRKLYFRLAAKTRPHSRKPSHFVSCVCVCVEKWWHSKPDGLS